VKIKNVIGHTIKVEGQKLHVEKELCDGLLHIVQLPDGALYRPINEETGERMMPDGAWLNEMNRRGVVEILADQHGPIVGELPPQPPMSPEEILAVDARAEARLTVIDGLVEQKVDANDPDLARHLRAVWTEKGLEAKFGPMPPVSTVRAWFRKVENDVASLSALMSKSGRVPRARRLDPQIVEIVERLARWYYALRGRRLQDVVAEAHRETNKVNVERKALGLPFLRPPSRETLRREIQRILCRETYAEKYGEKAAKSRWDGSGKGLSASVAFELGLMDDTVLDDIVVFDGRSAVPAGRPYICVLLDVATRVSPAHVVSFVPPTVQTAAACVRRAAFGMPVRPDRAARYPVLLEMNGKFDEIGVDNGANYVSTSFQHALADIGTTLRLMPVGSPRHKAMIERLFHTLKTFLLEKLPGYTLNPAILREFGYDPQKDAAITISDLENLIADFFYAYHIVVHSGIGTQPANAFQKSIEKHGRNIVANPAKLATLVHSVMRRRITRAGVRAFGGMRFTHPQNVPSLLDAIVAREKVRNRTRSGTTATGLVKYDPEDLGAVWMLNPDTNEYLRLDNVDQEYAKGLPLWRHRQIVRWIEKENLAFNTVAERLEARRQLNERILELAPEMKNRERRAMARMLGKPLTEAEVDFAEAPPTHDGLAPVIEHDLAADERIDAEVELSRPANNAGGETAGDEDPRDEGEPDLEIDWNDPLWNSPPDEDELWEDLA
jgi:putative transposase